MRRFLLVWVCVITALSVQGQAAKMQRIDSMKQVLQTTGMPDTTRAELLATISFFYWTQNTADGLAYGRQALALSQRLHFLRGIAGSNMALAMNHRYRSEYREALACCDSALVIWQRLGKKNKVGNTYFTMCMLYVDMSEYHKALDYGLRALHIAEELNDSDQIGRTLINLGIIYEDLGDHNNALELHSRALALYRSMGQERGIAFALSNIGLVYKEKGDLDSALAIQIQALEMMKTIPESRAKVLGYIGDIYNARKDYRQALTYLSQALQIDEVRGDPGGRAEKLQNIGRTYLAAATDASLHLSLAVVRQYLRNAATALDTAAIIHRQTGNIRDLAQNYADLSQSYELLGEPSLALKYHKLFTASKDTLFATEKTRQITEMQTRYETREKDKQIADQDRRLEYNRKINIALVSITLLVIALAIFIWVSMRRTANLNRRITEQNEELARLNEVKDRMFSIIGHDLRAPVNSLVSFMQLLEGEQLSPERISKYAEVLSGNLSYTTSLLENLLNWARTQMQGVQPQLVKIELRSLVSEIVYGITSDATRKQIHLNLTEGPSVHTLADINMLSLVLRNLIGNAVKYTPIGGSISVSINQQAGKAHIRITDTGVGIPPEILSQLNGTANTGVLKSTQGTAKEKGTGLGLMLCKTYIAQMGGTWQLSPHENIGTCIDVYLPVV